MMFDDLEQLKRKVEQLKTDRDKAEGAYQQLLSRIKEEYGCDSLKAAKVKLVELEEKEREWAVKATTAKKAFEEKYRDQLMEE